MASASTAAVGRATHTTSHIFVVGLPRTGSTLTRGILNASGEARLGGESHFLSEPIHLGFGRRLGYRDRFRRVGDIATDAGLTRVVEYIYGLRGKSFWTRMAANTDREAFEAELRASERTDRALLDVAMSQYARGMPIRGEKTPHHIHHVPTLLDWYPGARIVHTFRDPRAVYVSLRRKERPVKLTAMGRVARRLGPLFERYAIANFIGRWRSMTQLHRLYTERYPDRYTLVRFEDLVIDPTSTTRALADFLGIEYTDAMLDQVVHNSSFVGKRSESGIDVGTLDRWQGHLSSETRSRFSRELKLELVEFGYAP